MKIDSAVAHPTDRLFVIDPIGIFVWRKPNDSEKSPSDQGRNQQQ